MRVILLIAILLGLLSWVCCNQAKDMEFQRTLAAEEAQKRAPSNFSDHEMYPGFGQTAHELEYENIGEGLAFVAITLLLVLASRSVLRFTSMTED